ncbi:MAG: TIGR03364 family FAD-dependent oxidoreductase [Bacteroidia bacterium]|nr:TIGR03364 family FAD-dependent oxidoreductase [Bacteroidia bacterium]
MAQSKHKIAIVGAGVIGLGLAYAAARRGISVSLYERNEKAVGASIRNFGMIWPIGQAKGKAFNRSMNSRKIWQELAEEAGFWFDPCGSLLLIRREDEGHVAEEFYEGRKDEGYELELLSREEVLKKSPTAKANGILGGLFSRTEMIVDPREANLKTSALLKEKYGVEFHFKTPIDREKLLEIAGENDHVFVASGPDLESLYPEAMVNSGIVKVKLQMLATGPQPNNWRMGPSIYGGLTLQHYASFSHCKSLAAVKHRIAQESPWFNSWGIHVMMSQNGLGELIIGDTHEYGHTHDPFINEDLNEYVLDYLHEMADFPLKSIARRWVGIYAKLPGQIDFVNKVERNITLVNGVGGAGMTHSLGLGEEVIHNFFDENIP